ncbi:hypothetical protein MFLAVUS_006887 [Mucor flavus]|uniref:F-box domain-containing protein n=1 Tax=Mucor flavus TaxID=439312 RepID=A0ABP9Z2S2_9FUNG
MIFKYASKTYLPKDDETYRQKRDIRTCLLVCKSWSLAARHTLGPGLTIRVDEHDLARLSMDMFDLCKKVTTLKLYTSRDVPNTPKLGAQFGSLLNMCANSISVYYCHVSNLLVQLRNLASAKGRSPKLYNITVVDKYLNRWTQQAFIDAIIRFKATLTYMRIYYLEDILKKYSFPEFISLFPVLTRFRARTTRFCCPAFSYSQIFKAAPQLQDLTLEYGTALTEFDNSDSIKPIDYWNLVKLNLVVGGMDVKTLRYVIRRVNRVHDFQLYVGTVTSDVYSDTEAEESFNEIKNCTAKMGKFKVDYTYSGGICSLSPDEESFKLKPKPNYKETEYSHYRIDSDSDEYNYRRGI